MVALELDLPLVECYDLREVEFNLREADEDTISPAALDEARRRFEQTGRCDAFPFAEPSERLRLRVRRAIDAIVAANPKRRVAVVCHGGVINAYLADIYGIERDMFFLPRNTSINSLRVLGDACFVDRPNDAHHLAGIAGEWSTSSANSAGDR